MKCKIILFSLMLLGIKTTLNAQTLPVGIFESVEDAYRRQQLLGNDQSNSSYMIRPLNVSDRNNVLFSPDSLSHSLQSFRKQIYVNEKLKTVIYALPVVWQQQINSHHPYGMNDGAMIPSRGYQTQFSAGIYAKIGPLSIQFRPEVIYAQNKDFRDITETTNATDFVRQYINQYNRIDLPSKFGEGRYSKFNLGQSSIRLTFDPVSVGLSNENLWWGPGMRNSLLMSNNAAGFKHVTLNTTRPVNTPVGSFETQIIGGRLDPSGIALPAGSGYRAKPSDWRYISGIVFTYQPKWVPNLFLGFDRTFIVYSKDMGSGLKNYLPFLSAIEKKSYEVGGGAATTDDQAKRDQYISFFARWVMPEAKAEVYMQYGRNDHAYDTRDLLVELDHSRAYIAGFRKLVPLKRRSDEYIQVGLEFTQMAATETKNVRVAPAWYAHHQVTAGYTQQGQILGAGIGPGSNMQTLDVSWVRGLKKIGLQIERYVHDNDLFYASVPYTADLRRNWVDLGLTGKLDWDFGPLLVSSQLAYIRSYNYQYTFERPPQDYDNFFDWDKQDVGNLHVKVGLMYKF